MRVIYWSHLLPLLLFTFRLFVKPGRLGGGAMKFSSSSECGLMHAFWITFPTMQLGSTGSDSFTGLAAFNSALKSPCRSAGVNTVEIPAVFEYCRLPWYANMKNVFRFLPLSS